MGVRFRSNVMSSLLIAGVLVTGSIAYANGATLFDEATAPAEKSVEVVLVELQPLPVKSPFLNAFDLESEILKFQFSAAGIVEEDYESIEEVGVVKEESLTTLSASIDYGECAQWRDIALEVGWPEEEWDRLNYVIWRESRCLPEAHNLTDPSGGSRGLMQINGFWCRKNQYTERGYLQDNEVLNTCEELFDPKTNLAAGLVIWKYGVDRRQCGWGPWSTKNSRWCKS